MILRNFFIIYFLNFRLKWSDILAFSTILYPYLCKRLIYLIHYCENLTSEALNIWKETCLFKPNILVTKCLFRSRKCPNCGWRGIWTVRADAEGAEGKWKDRGRGDRRIEHSARATDDPDQGCWHGCFQEGQGGTWMDYQGEGGHFIRLLYGVFNFVNTCSGFFFFWKIEFWAPTKIASLARRNN